MTTELVDSPAERGEAAVNNAIPSRLGELLHVLTGTPDHKLTFRSSEGDIGSGYHVTELKQASIKSIDCGGRTSQWQETVLQLLDGSGGTHMTVGKFIAIARKSEDALPGLSEMPLFFEYAPHNEGLRRMKVVGLDVQDQRAVILLGDDKAVCKPFADWQNAAADCCTPKPQARKCC